MRCVKNTIEQTMGILRNRVNELGIGEQCQQQGPHVLLVDLPGIQDAARAKQILGEPLPLQFYLVDQDNDPQIAKQTGCCSEWVVKMYVMDGRPIY